MNWHLHRDERGQLVLTDAQGNAHIGIEAIRAFPITSPEQGIALCDADGVELIWLERLDTLEPGQRELVEDALAQRHFLPVIMSIEAIEGRIEPTAWQVTTDRGPTKFMLKSSEDVRRIAGSRVLVVDSHGIRYLIPDLQGLDGRSRRRLGRYV